MFRSSLHPVHLYVYFPATVYCDRNVAERTNNEPECPEAGMKNMEKPDIQQDETGSRKDPAGRITRHQTTTTITGGPACSTE